MSSIEEQVTRRWPGIESFAQSASLPPDGTFRSRAPASPEQGERALESLARVEGALHARLELGEELGRGGMGVVRLARQQSLQRDVAVKALLAHRTAPDSALKMLQEAWITGTLEHPNVVPVYDIGLDDAGQPLIVLKRVQGRPWSELLADPEAVTETFGADDVLEWHLRLFMQVCNAVEFAHRRRLVHLDIKPSNVMVGELGEVYVMDWGLAMSLGDHPQLPKAADCHDVVGTPAYLAPELLLADGGFISERTDVYLLGSTLFEILAGEPPHLGPTLVAMFYKALHGPHDLPADTPAELVRLVRRAMAKEPSDRFATATDLARDVQQFLEHRVSMRLTREAQQSRVALEQALAADVDDRRQPVYAAWSAARFGFQQALRSWPDNGAARDGLQRAAAAMVRYELDSGDARAARTVAAALDPVPADLAAELEAAEEEQRRREAQLAQLDPLRGQRTRFLAGLIFGLIFVTRPLVDHFVFGTEAIPYPRLLVAPWVYAALVGGAAWLSRQQLGRSRVTRQFYATLIFNFAAQFGLTVAGMELGVPAASFDVLLLFHWSVVATMATIAFERRAWPTAAGYSLAFLASLLLEIDSGRVLLVAAANCALVGNILWVWWPETWRRGGGPS